MSQLFKGEEQNDALLDSLYPMLSKAKLSLSELQTSPENILKLFRVTQLVMELQHIYVDEDNLKMQEMEGEVQRLQGLLSRSSVGAANYSGSPIHILHKFQFNQ